MGENIRQVRITLLGAGTVSLNLLAYSRQEDGVPAAIKAIYTYLDRAGKNRTMLEKAK